MSYFRAASRLLKGTLIFLLLILSTLVSIGNYSAHSTSLSDGPCNPTTYLGTYIGTCNDVSPGKYSQKLGDDFPNFASVKLSYPTGAILTNSTGDLLFNVTLNPLMFNPLSAQVGSLVNVWGTGFSSSDTTCSISGNPVSASACTISGGTLTGSFTVANVLAGKYTITGTGIQNGDFSSNTFTVLPPSLILNPSSGPTGTTVDVSGFGFYTTDLTCTLIGGPVPPIPCAIAPHPPAPGGTIGIAPLLSFVVPPASATGVYSITVTTNGGDTGEASASFTVTPLGSPSITLSPSSGLGPPPPLTVSVSGSGFSVTDTTCSLSGNPVSTPTSCAIVGGTIAVGLSFTVANVQAGVYTITVTGSPGGDSATASFQVLPSAPTTPIYAVVSIDIYVPPDFTGLTLSQIWTSFTNDYDQNVISLRRQSGADQIGPNWWKISLSNLTVTNSPSLYSPALVARRIFIVNRSQYIRLFQVTSPIIAGRYFFKTFINGQSIGAANFPTISVKGSRDPAYISGTLRDFGDRNVTRAGQPIVLPSGTGAQIVATGFDYLGKPVSAQAFINSTVDIDDDSSQGQYTLFGVAPGTYNITAYAAGYIPTTRPTTVSVAAAQSLSAVDIYMSESVNITGVVLSKAADGSIIPWGTVCAPSNSNSPQCIGGRPTPRAITVQLLNTGGTIIASNRPPFGFLTATTPTLTSYSFTIQNELSSFDGRIPQDNAGFTSGLSSGTDYLLRAYVTSYIQLDEIRVHVTNETTVTFSTIPLIRTGIFNVTVHFKNSNSTGSILVDNPLYPGLPFGNYTLTASAYDMQGILRAQNRTTINVNTANNPSSAAIELMGFSNAGSLGTVSLFSQNYGIPPGTYYIQTRLTARPSVAGNAATGTNAPLPGSLVVGDLYYQTAEFLATIGLGEGVVEISLPMYKASGLQLGIYSIDDQLPPLYEPWSFPGKTVQITLVPAVEPTVYQTNTTQPFNSATKLVSITGLKPGGYDLLIQTLGYTQEQILHFNVVLGGNADASVRMIANPVINLTVAFTNERLLSIINSTQPYAQPINHIDGTPVRIEVFDDRGDFVAANVSYIPNTSSNQKSIRIANFTLAGFDVYYGDPRYIWSGFYDTTDGARQSSGGLFLYPWDNEPRQFTIRIWVDGYYQLAPLQVTIPPRQDISIVTSMDRASRIYGTVAGPDFFDQALPLSWATITLQPNNYTLTSIIDVRPGNYTTSSLDGSFQVWVPEGTYGMGVTLAGYSSYSAQVAVPSGSDFNMWIWLDNYQTSLLAVSPEPLPMLRSAPPTTIGALLDCKFVSKT